MVGLTQMGMLWLEPSPKSIVLWLETVGLWHWVTTFTKPSSFQFSWHKKNMYRTLNSSKDNCKKKGPYIVFNEGATAGHSFGLTWKDVGCGSGISM